MTTLPSKKIVLSTGAKITVMTATRLMGLQRAALVGEASKKWEGKEDLSVEEQLLKYDETMLFPALKACSDISGKKEITVDDFEALAEADAQLWINAVKVINSHWLPIEDEVVEEKELQEKKD